MFKPQPQRLAASPTGHAAAFLDEARDALGENDPDAIFNAALDFAGRHKLDARCIGVLLAELYRRRQLTLQVLQAWLRDGKDALAEAWIPHDEDAALHAEINEHATVADWEHAEILRELGVWYARLNGEFFANALPPAAISVGRSRKETLGWYLPVRDPLGLRFRININELYIGSPLALILGILLHEGLHLEEDVRRHRQRAGSYHSSWFRKRAAELGIPTDEGGHWRGIEPGGRFAALLKRHGVALDEQIASSSPPETRGTPGGSRLAKWSCGCTNVRVSSGVELMANCDRCERKFERYA